MNTKIPSFKEIYSSSEKNVTYSTFIKRIQRGGGVNESLLIKSKIRKNGRICSKCDTFFSWDNFYVDTSTSTGFTSKCKQCCSTALKNKGLRKKLDKIFLNDQNIQKNFRIFSKIGKKISKDDLNDMKISFFENKGYENDLLKQVFS